MLDAMNDSIYGFSSAHLSGLALLAAISAAVLALYKRKQLKIGAKTPAEDLASLNEKNKNRPHGTWNPLPPNIYSFSEPEVHPTAGGDVLQIDPIIYRPWRWGQYHVTMGLKSLNQSEWFEVDKQYPDYHRIRKHRIATRGHNVVRLLSAKEVGNGDVVREGVCAQAAVELLLSAAHYLAGRYPKSYQLSSDGRSIFIPPVNETYSLPSPLWHGEGEKRQMRDVSREEGEEALRTCALLVQDDLAIMIEGNDSQYYFQGGAICVPGFWRMRDKIGRPLDEIHTSGNVPYYEQNLRASMNRFFLKFPVDKPVTRNNYFLQIVQPKPPTCTQDSTYPSSGTTPINSTGLNAKVYDSAYNPIDPEELAWSATTNGPEDEYRPGHAHQPPEGKPLIVTPETLRMRTERQTLRRLPGSGAIVFGIRTYVWEIEKIKEETEEVGEGKRESVAERFASAIRGWPEQVRTYKGATVYEDVLVPYLESK
ncbi:uncharacterized protein SCHCODRAFT_02624391 [Schizophyllum commune H4-8]|uniref:Uncharacterized protein n=1 Tax=Schizophyllum commune (strain H4-8 / FGSC 9210) TaxID=578458 RepID=D8PLF9_SCHCM|nr:uncharacterized protein SCHCODRAFT_02624391 [Schizophyllum commune H4-8]KAI5894337.1 hypothetical protein SCHCODRAFT_02624391 [Schizophyllum commune H4-8]